MNRWKGIILLTVFCGVLFTGCAKNDIRVPSQSEGRENDAAGQDPQERPEGAAASQAQVPEHADKPVQKPQNDAPEHRTGEEDADKSSEEEIAGDGRGEGIIRPEGMTLETRFAEPEGFSRVQGEEGSLLAFLREYPVKEDGSPVLLYNGTEKGNQRAHAAVLALPIESEDLQQCADSVMRVYAEYFWESGQKERIAFHFVNGFYAQYTRWRDGERIRVEGNEVTWVQTDGFDDSYENLKKYLRYVFSYAGTLSMDAESEPVPADDLRAGDVFLKGGSPGHVVMVVDLCEDGQGDRAFLLAQGYMPAQEFHVLKNPLHEDDPWYYADELRFPLRTPEYTFEEGSLRRLAY